MPKITITIGLEDYIYHWVSKQENRSAFVNEILEFAFETIVQKNIDTPEQVDLMINEIQHKIKDMNHDIRKLEAVKKKLEKRNGNSVDDNE